MSSVQFLHSVQALSLYSFLLYNMFLFQCPEDIYLLSSAYEDLHFKTEPLFSWCEKEKQFRFNSATSYKIMNNIIF